jgi:hypothetical protein
MNRILQNNNKFQVLTTPSYVSAPSMELMLGAWSDEHLRGYKIVSFTSLQDAMDLAFKYPPINWNKLVNIHEDSFRIITNSVKKNLQQRNFIVEIDNHLMNPSELKETMFKRIEHLGERYNLYYNANDVICINIINPWTKNLYEITTLLKNIPELRIKKIHKSKTHITLIGLTDVNTTYEIRLWTTLMAQWARWIHMNKLEPQQYFYMINQIIETQKNVDNGYNIV